MPRVPNVSAFELAPDWVCEVLSPSTAVVDRTKKLPIYAREGVGCIWLVDPLLRTLEAMRLAEGHWIVLTVLGPDTGPAARIEPFTEIELELGRFWLEPS